MTPGPSIAILVAAKRTEVDIMPDHPPPSLTDWITAVSTGVTALAAGIAGFIAWLAFRRDVKSSFPIVEANITWADERYGNYIEFRPVIRNQLYETIVLNSVQIKRPRGAFIAKKIFQDFYGDLIGLEKGSSTIAVVNREIRPAESTTDFASPGLMRPADIYVESFYFSPPEEWVGGTVKLILRLSSKALTIRDRRITIKRRMSPRPVRQTEEKANSQGADIPQ
jgi:hypothetical protein